MIAKFGVSLLKYQGSNILRKVVMSLKTAAYFSASGQKIQFPKNSRRLFFGNRVKNAIRAELSSSGVGNEVVEGAVEIRAGQEILKGYVHSPAPVVT